MNEVYFDFEKMGRLLASFYNVSRVRYSLADVKNNLLCFSNDFSSYCNRINSNPEGHTRCKECDQHALSTLKSSNLNRYTYHCHAGLLETVIPIRHQGECIAFIFFGQMIHQDDPEGQWLSALDKLSWLAEPEAMREDFFQVQRVDDKTIESCSELLTACSQYIMMEAVIRAAPQSEMQKLSAWLDEHYSEAPMLDDIAKALSMSKTKLCVTAQKHGTTVNSMICERQMEAARGLLANTDLRISEIATMVGVRDYNYFTKLFKAKTGMPPSTYRKKFRAIPHSAGAV